jgi:putative lipoprotein
VRRALAVGLVLALSSPALAADPDPWFGRDKALHFAATASLAVAGYGGAALKTSDPVARAAVGGTLGLGAGIAKELFDLAGAGDPSWRDLTWDLVGTATGVLVATAVDYLIRQATAPSD